MMRDADGVSCQAGVLPRIIRSNVLQSQNLHVLICCVHTCSLDKERRIKMKCISQTCVSGSVQFRDTAGVIMNKGLKQKHIVLS